MRIEERCQGEAGLLIRILNSWHIIIMGVAVLGVLALAAAAVYAWRSDVAIRSLGAFGYPGVFLVAFLSSATILLPVPGLVVSLGAGAVWNPVVVGLAAGVGAGTGELVGYAAGRAGRATLGNRTGARWHAAEAWLSRFGFWAILAMAVVPNPVFDAVGLAAGALCYPSIRFWIAAALGNCLKYAAFAYLGGVITWPLG